VQAYRAEDFPRAASIYKELAVDKAALANEKYDLRINALATDAQLEWAGKSNLVQNKRPRREDLETFEAAYNVACEIIARGELTQGELLLRRAKGW
jgi:signal recognition particle subunit SRP72